MRAYELEKDADVNDDADLYEVKMTNIKDEVKIIGKSLRPLLFCKRMKRLLQHRMRNKTVFVC
jgi:hypothetical protein